MNRQERARIAEETLAILESGTYRARSGTQISIAGQLAAARAATRLYVPADLDGLLRQAAGKRRYESTSIEVTDRGTLEAGHALHRRYDRVACLNFASAKNPGGGFKTGAQAQEECLARASGLFATLETQSSFYEHHRQLSTSLYSDHLIFSPGVPVFRDAEDRLIEAPWETAMITAAAVNAGAVRENEPKNAGKIRPAMERRTRCVLAAAAANDCDALVLGAWGCGVFRNDPAQIAEIFAMELQSANFRGLFRHVELAILDRTPGQGTLRAFEKVFRS
jgi:uncharacterized protein (TIGR02452 family)